MNFYEKIEKLNLKVSNLYDVINGGNSNVVKAKLENEAFIAIKIYKGEPSRIRTMLGREYMAIKFLSERNFLNIPEILEVREDLGLIVYRWIDGVHPISNKKSMDSIKFMCSSLNSLEKKGESFVNAIDAAFSLYDIYFQIKKRINLFKIEKKSELSKMAFLLLEEKLEKYKILFKNDKVFLSHTLSISDIGTHNMLYNGNSFKFIDFEFFGKDSVDKMMGDFLLHPRNEFNESEILDFKEFISSQLNWEIENLNVILPILSLKWAAIAFRREILSIEEGKSQSSIIKLLYETNGMKYLRYFDYLTSIESNDLISTFNHFAANI